MTGVRKAKMTNRRSTDNKMKSLSISCIFEMVTRAVKGKLRLLRKIGTNRKREANEAERTVLQGKAPREEECKPKGINRIGTRMI